PDRHVPLGHDLEQRRLDLGRGPVDLVGQHDVGEHGAELDLEGLRRRLVDPGADEVGGDQVGGELHLDKVTAHRAGQRLGGQRLGQAGRPLQQAVAPGQQADEQPLGHPVLADDDLLDFEQGPLQDLRLGPLLHRKLDHDLQDRVRSWEFPGRPLRAGRGVGKASTKNGGRSDPIRPRPAGSRWACVHRTTRQRSTGSELRFLPWVVSRRYLSVRRLCPPDGAVPRQPTCHPPLLIPRSWPSPTLPPRWSRSCAPWRTAASPSRRRRTGREPWPPSAPTTSWWWSTTASGRGRWSSSGPCGAAPRSRSSCCPRRPTSSPWWRPSKPAPTTSSAFRPGGGSWWPGPGPPSGGAPSRRPRRRSSRSAPSGSTRPATS